MSLNKVSASSAIKLLAVFSGTLCASAAIAATDSRNLTVTPTQNFGGVIIVDQHSGAVDLCTAVATFTGAQLGLSGKCIKIGHATPATVPPSAPIGLSVLVVELESEAEKNMAWIVNNQSGVITVCVSASGPEGNCLDLGVAPE